MNKSKVLKALDKLQKAQEKFNQAITDFNSVYNPNAVGLAEWIDYNEEVMFDLEQDIAETFEEETV